MYIFRLYVCMYVCMYVYALEESESDSVQSSQAKPIPHVHSSTNTLVASSILCISEKFPDRVNSFILTVRGYDSVRKAGPEKNLVGLDAMQRSLLVHRRPFVQRLKSKGSGVYLHFQANLLSSPLLDEDRCCSGRVKKKVLARDCAARGRWRKREVSLRSTAPEWMSKYPQCILIETLHPVTLLLL
jgi:hypothetical protein